MKRFFYFAAVMVLLAACGGKDPEVVITKINLNKTAITIGLGSTEQLVATIEPSSIERKIVWSSSDETIATVTSNGTVKGIAIGTATITASQDGVTSAPCTVTVTDPYELVEFFEWGMMDNPTSTGEIQESTGREIYYLPIALLSKEISVDAEGYFLWSDGDNFMMYVYMVCTMDDQYIYILGDITADLDFWNETRWLPKTFMPSIYGNEDTYYSIFFKRVYTGNAEEDAELSGDVAVLTDGMYNLDYDDLVGSYNLTVQFLDSGNERIFEFTRNSSTAGAPVKGSEGIRIKKSDVKVFKGLDDNFVKKLPKRFK